MESPFDNAASSVCSLFLEPVLNSHYKIYQSILTVSNIPNGPLANLIARTNAPKLSTFSPPQSPNCSLIVCRYPCNGHLNNSKNMNQFMYSEDIPNVIGYLENNGYEIMYNVTNMAHKGKVEYTDRPAKKLVFLFSYKPHPPHPPHVSL